MFGLMKARCCGTDAVQRESRRLHYCGTCKTMGRLYGQGSRIFLNYDAVFLGELLTALTPQPTAFADAYISRNCLAIPAQSQLPLALQYAATANVLLTEFKLIDHIADTESRAARATHFLFSQSFRKARKLLDTWRFPLRELCAQLQSQTARERGADLTLDGVAEPTAIATSLIFQQGAALIAAREETIRVMAAIGHLFGRIVYLIDALQDREKDAATGAFNALAATSMSMDSAQHQLATYQEAIVAQLRALPIEPAKTNVFVARLAHNLRPLLAAGGGGEGPKVMIAKGSSRRRRARFCSSCDCDCCCDACGDAEICSSCCEIASCCDGCDCGSCCNV